MPLLDPAKHYGLTDLDHMDVLLLARNNAHLVQSVFEVSNDPSRHVKWKRRIYAHIHAIFLRRRERYSSCRHSGSNWCWHVFRTKTHGRENLYFDATVAEAFR